jgi:uncharacterized protein YkwD
MIPARLASGLGARAFTALVVGAVLTLSAAAFTPAAGAAVHRRCAHANSSVARASPRVLRRAVLCLVNRQRTARHLPRLHASKRLNRSAQGWTNTMVRAGLFSHGTNFAARISSVGFRWSTAGENIAAGYGTPASVVRAWMASPGHCRNILTPNFLDLGTGLSAAGVQGSGGGTWTQDFALPLFASARSHNWGPADGCPYG